MQEQIPYQKKFTVEQRIKQRIDIEARFQAQNLTQIIVQKYKKCKLISLQKEKLLVSSQMKILELLNALKERYLKLQGNESLFLFCNNKLLDNSIYIVNLTDKTIEQIQKEYADKEDGNIYIYYHSQETMG